jgi:hypothetical protein
MVLHSWSYRVPMRRSAAPQVEQRGPVALQTLIWIWPIET